MNRRSLILAVSGQLAVLKRDYDAPEPERFTFTAVRNFSEHEVIGVAYLAVEMTVPGESKPQRLTISGDLESSVIKWIMRNEKFRGELSA